MKVILEGVGALLGLVLLLFLFATALMLFIKIVTWIWR